MVRNNYDYFNKKIFKKKSKKKLKSNLVIETIILINFNFFFYRYFIKNIKLNIKKFEKFFYNRI